MGRKYSAVVNDTNTDNTSIGYICAPATPQSRIRVFEYKLGSRASPAENACGYEFNRISDENATPGGSAITPTALDSGDPGAQATVISAPTAEPTVTAGALLDYVALNQRATFRWVANPGAEWVMPASEDNGVSLVADTPAPSAFAEHCTLYWEE